MLQIAHKQLVQEPKYALDFIAQEVRQSMQMLFTSVNEVVMFYEQVQPSARKVVQILKCEPSNASEAAAFRYFTQYIRAQSDKNLMKFLRYLTGSDIICMDKITVSFSKLEGLQRRIIAHTCGPVVELPSTYSAYREFRLEMDNTLASTEAWKMDIV
jgi:hypothetical protein